MMVCTGPRVCMLQEYASCLVDLSSHAQRQEARRYQGNKPMSIRSGSVAAGYTRMRLVCTNIYDAHIYLIYTCGVLALQLVTAVYIMNLRTYIPTTRVY